MFREVYVLSVNDSEIKSKIQELADLKYRGVYKKFRLKMLRSLVGDEGISRIFSLTPPEVHQSCSLTILCFMRGIQEIPRCACGNPTKFNPATKEFQKSCSVKCNWIYHNEEIQNKKRDTCNSKYGHGNVLASEYGRAKARSTSMKKYGVDNYTKTDDYKLRAKKRNPNSDKIKQRLLNNNYNTLSTKFPHVEPLFSLDEYIGVKGYIKYPWKCKTCERSFMDSCDNGSSPICPYCKPTGTDIEIAIREILDKWEIKYVFRYRGLPSGKEVDFYIPSRNLAIEIHGLYWHSTAHIGYSKTDHISKLEECEEQSIKLVSIYADEIYHKLPIVRNRLRSALGLTNRKLGARKCEIVKVDNFTCGQFLDKYHIQGRIASTHRYGLTYKGRLVAVMTFNKGRYATGRLSTDGIFEIGRYATVSSFNITGGASKLLTHFWKNHSPVEVFSYADRRWSNGNLYEKIGMTFIRNTSPNYWYTKDFRSRFHRVKYQKSKLLKFPSYSDDKTEEEIMREEKYFKTWDCGSKLYSKK